MELYQVYAVWDDNPYDHLGDTKTIADARNLIDRHKRHSNREKIRAYEIYTRKKHYDFKEVIEVDNGNG